MGHLASDGWVKVCWMRWHALQGPVGAANDVISKFWEGKRPYCTAAPRCARCGIPWDLLAQQLVTRNCITPWCWSQVCAHAPPEAQGSAR